MPNQAAMGILQQACFSLHAENSFFVPEMASGGMSLCLPSKTGTFGLTFNDYGYSAYQEVNTGLAFGRAFGSRFRAGIGMSYFAIRQFADYGNLHAFVTEFGIQVLPVQQLTLGFHVFNPAGQCYYPKGYRMIPTVIRAGMGYSVGHEILLCFELKKESNCKAVYCGGVEYECSKLIIFRMGFSSSVSLQYSFGLGIRKDHFRTNVSVIHHPVLGYSPAITLAYTLK